MLSLASDIKYAGEEATTEEDGGWTYEEAGESCGERFEELADR